MAAAPAGAEMGLAAGGRMRQHLYPDPHGLDTWDQGNYGRVFVHIVNSQLWREITGRAVPAHARRRPRLHQRRLPLVRALRRPARATSRPPTMLANVKSVAQKDAQHGFTGQQDDAPLQTPNVKPLGNSVPDGKW